MIDRKHMKISFIGGGNMARALISGMLRQGFDAAAISVVDPDADKLASLQQDFGVTTTAQLPSVSAADVIVLAVKPQQLRDLSIFLGSLLQHQLVISIAAGIRCNDLARWLGGYAAIVRVMPNTPAQVQRGLSALFAMPAVSATQRAQAEQVLQAVGKIMWLDAETKMDAVTAISGSGPAYVFYFMEALQQAAVELGFTEDEARMLTLQTFSGASALADASAESAAVLRQQVTSKGGTTEQALLSMEDAAVKAAIVRAAHAAAERSRTLGDQLGRD